MKTVRMKSKRGQADFWVMLVAGLGVGVVTIAIIAIMLSAFKETQTANSIGANITGQGLTFLDNASKQLPTAGTVVGVSLLLLILGAVGFGGYMAYKKMNE